MTMPVPPTAGTPAAPATPPAPPPAPVVGTSTGENFGPAPAPAAGAAPAAPQAGQGGSPAGGAPADPAKPGKGKDGQRYTLSKQDLDERIQRAKSSTLKDLHGTDDPNVIRERLKKLDEMEKREEEAKRAAMTEQQRLQHDLTKARAERDRYRGELAAAQERQVVQEQGAFVERLASQYVNPAALEEASLAFSRHVSALDPKQVAKMTEKDVGQWFRSYVQKKPFMAKTAGDGGGAPPARRVVERPAGAPRQAPRPAAAPAAAGQGGKTFRPGQPNSMTRQEAKEAARAKGYSW